jgi:hypothetical protein
MRVKKGLVGIAVIAVVIISITAFSITQATTHPTDVSVISMGKQQDYLVKGTPDETVNLTLNGINQTLYLQLLTPSGNLPSDTPFLIEVNAFIVSSDTSLNQIMINVAANHFYLNKSLLPISDVYHSLLNGTILQTVYHSVSTNESITNLTHFSANVTVSFFEGFGPYYYSVKTVSLLI